MRNYFAQFNIGAVTFVCNPRTPRDYVGLSLRDSWSSAFLSHSSSVLKRRAFLKCAVGGRRASGWIKGLLSAFGVFLTGEGLGGSWPGKELAIFGFAMTFLLLGFVMASILRRPSIGSAR